MRKIYKITNIIALIFILIGIFLCQGLAYSLQDSSNLRPYLTFNGSGEKEQKTYATPHCVVYRISKENRDAIQLVKSLSDKTDRTCINIHELQELLMDAIAFLAHGDSEENALRKILGQTRPSFLEDKGKYLISYNYNQDTEVFSRKKGGA